MKLVLRSLVLLLVCYAVPASAEKVSKKAQKKPPTAAADAGTPSAPGPTPSGEAGRPADAPPASGAAPGGDVEFDDVPTAVQPKDVSGTAARAAAKNLQPKPKAPAPLASGAVNPPTANDTSGPPGSDTSGLPTAVWALLVLVAGALGAAGGWFARGKQMPPPRPSGSRDDRAAPPSLASQRTPLPSAPSAAAVVGRGGPERAPGAWTPPSIPQRPAPLPPDAIQSVAPPATTPTRPFAPPPPTNPGMSVSSPPTSQETPGLPPPRIGHGGPFANVLEPLDRGFQWFKAAAAADYVVQRFPEVANDLNQFDYLIRLLLDLSDRGSTAFESSTGDRLSIGNFDEWLEFFAANVLDVFSVRCSKYLLEGADGGAEAQAVGEIYLEVLRGQVPEALRVAGFDAVSAFPFQGERPSTETMRVVGNAYRSSHSGQIVGLRKYGLMQGRKLIRQAHVTVG